MSIDQKVIEYVNLRLSSSSHDIEHAFRVYKLADEISNDIKSTTEIDKQALKYACYLHDIARVADDNDTTGEIDHAILGAQQADAFLRSIGLNDNKIELIVECIKSHRYRSKFQPESIEAKILFDADKLDSIGAIGIARSFAWIGEHRGKIYDYPNLLSASILERINVDNSSEKKMHSIQVEYETKLKNIPESMHTEYSKEIAKKRLGYFKRYLEALENDLY